MKKKNHFKASISCGFENTSYRFPYLVSELVMVSPPHPYRLSGSPMLR